jgi:DNA phosphorothioation-associated putative methyltransferase
MDTESIDRHRTAIRRNKLSRPVSLLLETQLLNNENSFFDYGCGHGQDLELLAMNGYANIGGFDPYYRPDTEVKEADVVNLGYVLNVIENPKERAETLKKAFSLTKSVLCVSVMPSSQQGYQGEEFSDGVLSSRKTFQKYFEQSEIKNYIESTIDRDAISVQPGIFFVFKEEKTKLDYLSSRYKSPAFLEVTRLDPITREARKERIFRPKIQELIKQSPFFEQTINFLYSHGRLPKPEEDVAFNQLISEFKSKKKIQNIILDSVDQDQLELIKKSKKENLLVFMALRRFDRKGFPKSTDISSMMMADIKEFFSSYLDLRKQSEALLFSLADDKAMSMAIKQSSTGKQLPDAIYIHPSYTTSLHPLIQVKVAIAQKLVGDIDECNLIKINKFKNKVSFLIYEDFDTIEHPALLYSWVMDIPKNDLKFWDFRTRENPPVLHRKDTFVGPDYPMYEQFRGLTIAEEEAGLLEDSYEIGTKDGWSRRLNNKNVDVKNHQVIVRK